MKNHGKVKFYWNANILYLEAFGPFNPEGVIEASNQYLNIISSTTLTQFSVIEMWDEESICSPEGVAVVAKMWERLAKSNCVSFALVTSNELQKSIAEKLLPPNGKIFFKKEEAENWVSGKNQRKKGSTE